MNLSSRTIAVILSLLVAGTLTAYATIGPGLPFREAVLAAGATVSYLNPGEETVNSSALTTVFDEARSRTTLDSGSQYTPPSISSPVDWPFAIVRTITRPLPNEARGLAQMLAAAEMVVLLGLGLHWRRNVAGLPAAILGNRFVAFAFGVLLLGGLAYSSFANLGVLTRQKSLLFPFLLLCLCVPARRGSRSPSRSGEALGETASARDFFQSSM